jgi:uncharacterized membrane protein YqhA
MNTQPRPILLRVALSMRLLMLIASLGSLIGALLMFWEGGAKLAAASQSVFAPTNGANVVIRLVMSATDSLIFGLVLLVFSFAITFGFVFNSFDAREKLPAWMRIDSLSELKRTLIEVILVYLIVDFATDLAEQEANRSWETLMLPLSIFIIAGALRLMSGVHSRTEQPH